MTGSKRKISVVLIGLLIMTLVSTIGFAAKKPAELTVCLPNFGASTDAQLQQEVVSYMEKQNNVKIKMITIPLNSYSDKLPVLLSSGDIPDVYQINKAMVNVQAYAIKGYAANIDSYVKRNKLFKQIDPKYLNWMRVNGKVHGIPREKEQEKVIWIRGDLADKYGVKLSSTPTTEEFYNEMKKVKGIIPLSFPKFLDNLPFFYASFGTYDEITMNKKKKYVDTFNSPEMKDALKYINRLYKDGILDKEFPTTDNTVLRNNLVSGRSVANIDYDNRFFYYNTEIERLNPGTKPSLRPIFKLVGPKGQGGTLNEAVQVAYLVSPKCKNIKAAVDLAAWMTLTADGIKAHRFGLAGKHYTVENGEVKATPKAEAGGMSLDPNGLLKNFVAYDDLNLGFRFPSEELSGTYKKMVANEVSKHSGPKHIIPAGKSAIYDKVGPSLIKKRQEIALKIILGTVSVEDGFKEYESYFKSINGVQMLKELNTR